MSKAAFDKIAEGLREALAVARGDAEPFRWHGKKPSAESSFDWEKTGRDIADRYSNTLDKLRK